LVFIHGLVAQNAVPGVEFMFAGYDIREANSKSIADGVKYSIFAQTYDMHQTFQHPGGPKYDVPDQMMAYPLDETYVLTSTNIFQEVTEMLTEEITNFNFGITYKVKDWGITAGFNRTAGKIHYIFNEKDMDAAKGHLDSRVAKFVLGPYMLFQLNPYLDLLLNKEIPQCPKSQQDLANLAMLVQVWGHVFPTEIFMGGRFDCVTALDQNLVNKYDKSWVVTQLSLTFTYKSFDIYAGGFKNRTDIKIDKIFSQMSNSSLFFLGGQRSLQTNDTIKPWFVSIDQSPDLVSASFLPLSLLAHDPVKQRNIEYVLTNHISTGAIAAPPCATIHTIGTKLLQPLPGTEFVGAGYDSLTMTVKGFIIDHTYNPGHSWTNPFYPTYQYAVADTLYVFDQTDNLEENYTSIAMSDSDFQLELKQRVSGSGFLGFGKHSSEMYVFQQYHEQHQFDQAMDTRSITWFDLELSPVVQVNYLEHMTGWAKQMFTNLGRNINDPNVKKQYLSALDFYGDSIVRRVSVGGSLYYQGYLNNNTVSTITIEHFHEQSSWSFFGLFGGGHSWNFYQKEVSEVVKANMVSEIKANGGIWNPQAYPFLKKTASGSYAFALKDVTEPLMAWDAFVTTIKDNMVPVHYEIVPLYTIFTDPVISNNFKIVTQEYLQSKMLRKK
jgi:hypothetical protein